METKASTNPQASKVREISATWATQSRHLIDRILRETPDYGFSLFRKVWDSTFNCRTEEFNREAMDAVQVGYEKRIQDAKFVVAILAFLHTIEGQVWSAERLIRMICVLAGFDAVTRLSLEISTGAVLANYEGRAKV